MADQVDGRGGSLDAGGRKQDPHCILILDCSAILAKGSLEGKEERLYRTAIHMVALALEIV
jgi:hypothetical protein